MIFALRLRVPSVKCQRGKFVYLLCNVPIQICAICYIVLEVDNMVFAIEKDGTQLLEKNFGTSTTLSLLLRNKNMP